MSRIAAIADAHRAALLRRDRQAAAAMTRAYTLTYQSLRQQFLDVLDTIEETQRAGARPRREQKLLLWRLQQLKPQVEEELRRYAAQAGDLITAEQWQAIQAAQRNAEQLLLEIGVPPRAGGVGADLAALGKAPGLEMVGLTREGSPLRDLLDRAAGETAQHVIDELTTGVLMGTGARQVGARITDASGMMLRRSELIARTEMMRAYRESTRLRYQQESGVVEGWIWTAGLGPRCCAACCAMHGSRHRLDERLDGHPGCRCVAVPIVRLPDGSDTGTGLQSGTDWFAAQEPALQRRILGSRAALLAYQEGAISLPDTVGRRRSEAWGTMRYQRSLTAILGPESALEWRRKAMA